MVRLCRKEIHPLTGGHVQGYPRENPIVPTRKYIPNQTLMKEVYGIEVMMRDRNRDRSSVKVLTM